MSHPESLYGYARRGLLMVISGSLGLCPLPGLAHGDLHEQIAAATSQIEKNPKNAELYLKRGELHRAHEDWDAALADYERAAILNPKLIVVDLARGKVLLAANWPLTAQL